ncbi:protein OSB1, mitochondrial-like [Triticum urartu]|uniref:Protein OSB1, mitochondrial n=1 Tax=Triticum urartu TaxID=4572 RepID=A0A8R7U540_TRIUA|nr:protein OSB1, mitochondrial-like [Triticum urartu]
MLRSLAAAAARSPAAAAWRRLLHHGRGIGGGEEAESMAYRMSMLRAPPVARKKDIVSSNSCSLIGRLNAPVRLHRNSSEEDPKAYTFLCVTPSSASSSTSANFHVTLQMKGAMANVCLKHLKYNDLVHVSGLLNSYHKVSGTGEKYMCYKIHVKELNYVHDPKKPRNDKDSVDPASTPSADSQTLEEIKYRERLRLWQVFFASPYEWWDNRQYKPYASCPDFKHKDTREQLWLHPDDPPWVRKQLELIDQQTAESGRRDGRGRLTNPRWNAQAFNYSDECDDDEQDTQRQANG